jgi:hypothetical protein
MLSRTLTNYRLIFLLIFAGIGLLAGLFAGLVRLGVLALPAQSISPLAHGALMINGFLGTLISLERAGALEKIWASAAPVTLAASTILFLLKAVIIAKFLFVAGAIFFLAVMIYLYRLQPEPYHLIMALGIATLLTGNILYLLNFPIFKLVAWWIGFPLLTILGERLELNRVMQPPKKAQSMFVAFISLWIVGVIITSFFRHAGWIIASVFLIAQALWLIKYDVARRTIRAFAWTRYSAVCLLTGYGWLILAGLFGLRYGLPRAGFLYDAQLHMIFVGFVFSMIFAHSSVIIPSLSGKSIPYHPFFYAPLVLLHGFLLVRVIGDITGFSFIRMIGGYGNVAAILLFLGSTVFQLARESKRRKKQLSQAINV